MDKKKPVRIVPLPKPHRGKYLYLVEFTKLPSHENESPRARSYFRTEKEARDFAERITAEQETEAAKITISEFAVVATDFIRARDTKKYTAMGYERALRDLLIWFPGDRKLESLGTAELVARLTELSDGKYNQHLIGLRMALDFAVKRGHLNRNPLASLHMRPSRRSPSSVLVPQAVGQFLCALARVNTELATIHALLFFSGLTLDELTRMDRAAIDLEKRTIYVSAAAARNGRARALSIPDNLHEWLLPAVPKEGPLWRVSRDYFYTVRREVCRKEGLPVLGLNSPLESFLYYRKPLVGIQAILEAGLETEPKGKWSKGCATSLEECEAYWAIFPPVGFSSTPVEASQSE